MNRNDYQSGRDTDQFPNNVSEIMLIYYEILKAGGFKNGGTNFDAKIRRQSIDQEDRILAHVGGFDCCARDLKAAVKLIESKEIIDFNERRYAKWQTKKTKTC